MKDINAVMQARMEAHNTTCVPELDTLTSNQLQHLLYDIFSELLKNDRTNSA